MRQQWIPKSIEQTSSSNDGHVTQEVGDSTISNKVLKEELKLHCQDHIQIIPIEREERYKSIFKIQKDH